jgi:transposase-like protein
MTNDSQRRDRTKEAFWRGRLTQQADSGLSVRAWCRKHEVKEAGFYWWRRELARRDARDAPRTFVPVQVTQDGPPDPGSPIEIVLADGRRVRLTGSVNGRMLADVLDVLERRAC